MLVQKIKDDMKEAMKARDDVRVQCLRMALSAFTNELVAKGRKPTDSLEDTEVLSVLKRIAKQRKDSAEQFTKGGRTEMAEKELKELAIMEAYLPPAVSRDEVLRIAREKIVELGVTDSAGAGKLTGAIMKVLGSQADGSVVKEVIAELLK